MPGLYEKLYRQDQKGFKYGPENHLKNCLNNVMLLNCLPGQVEGVVHDLRPVGLVELVAVGVEAPCDVFPVVPVVVDPIIPCIGPAIGHI